MKRMPAIKTKILMIAALTAGRNLILQLIF